MADRSQEPAFNAERFQLELGRLARRHGVLAIAGYVMVPLDAECHHVFRTEYGVSQVHIDQVGIAERRRGALEKVPA